ncbi:enolase C-terminal domain-like protein [Stratiformator vulcanicus]|uniref:Enolase C-terminal domain-containing protein n=1 Tax=Stratiformator vulcanicus TaxID=2527980 RepID=A0A517R2N1_9PLAN|nr:enolase C-terminal domain-like protein [Stratiformator vulcanicus]QDT38114.1 hypothetical protein Pan189_25040 [Stratiformator vulcanicus]
MHLLSADVALEPVPFRAPLKFGGRVVDRTQLINVTVRLEGEGGRTAVGFGSMPVGNVWAWPSSQVEPDTAEPAMIDFAREAAAEAVRLGKSEHPVVLMTDLMRRYDDVAIDVRQRASLPESLPKLAQLVAASSLDAAVHDAFGRLHAKSSYDVLGPEYMSGDLSRFLDDRFVGDTLDQFTSRTPKPTMPLYHLVGALDPLTDDDIEQRIDDGLPETLPEWIAAEGLTHLKIKLAGDDLAWDVDRVLRVDAVTADAQSRRGCEQWYYSLDFNEKCENAEYVVEFLSKLQERSPAAYGRVQYLEQPTSRHLRKSPDQQMHAAAKLKPVVIDEALTDYESLLTAVDLGYSGVALKACKGHTESLLLGAAAQKLGLFLCVQDLTCPGYSFLHSASLAARIPTVAAIEGNGRQYCPAPNEKWAKSYPEMFGLSDGTVQTADLTNEGLFGAKIENHDPV